MIYDLALMAPCMAAFFWTLILTFIKKSSKTHWVLLGIGIITSIYFYIDGILLNAKGIDYRQMVYLDFCRQVTTMLMFPVIILYLRLIRGKQVNSPYMAIAFLPAVIQGSSAFTVYKTMGINKAAAYIEALEIYGSGLATPSETIFDIYRLLIVHVFNIGFSLWIIGMAIATIMILKRNGYQWGDGYKFLFKGRQSSPINIIGCLLMLLYLLFIIRMGKGRAWLMDHAIVTSVCSILVGVILFFIFYTSSLFDKKKVSLEVLRDPLNRNGLKEDHYLEIEDESVIASTIRNANIKSELEEKFYKYIVKEENYLNPSLNIDITAEALNTNRTYISVLLKEVYKVPFRSFLNKLRIEKAKLILKNSPDKGLSEIAAESGFMSDSQLVKKFSEIEGCSPKAWLKQK